jgi:hypothetical protein
MTRSFTIPLCALLSFVAVGCSESKEEASTGGDAPVVLPDVDVKSQEEADAEATRAIDATNADAELEKLEEEIGE